MFFADPFKRNKLSRDKNVPRITCLMITLPVEKRIESFHFEELEWESVTKINTTLSNRLSAIILMHLGQIRWLS